MVVIGGGLAGLTAALFSARYGHSTLVIESTAPGGHLINIGKIEDFPGFPEGVAGYDLCPMVQEQAEQYGAQFEMAGVESLEQVGPIHGADPTSRGWAVVTSQGRHRVSTVIVASGAHSRDLGVPGETRLCGKGVSHCASCDGPFFRGRTVGVVGGGDHALQEALTLAELAGNVIVLNPGASFSGQETYRRRVAEHNAIEARHHVDVLEVLGETVVTGVRIREHETGTEGELELAGLFVYAGLVPNTAFLRGETPVAGTPKSDDGNGTGGRVALLPLAPDGRIPVDGWMRTALPGLFAAGDVRDGSAGHAITSAADGATAAVAAHRYLSECA